MQYVKLLYKLLSRNLIEIVEEKNRVKSWRGGLYTGQFEKWIQLCSDLNEGAFAQGSN